MSVLGINPAFPNQDPYHWLTYFFPAFLVSSMSHRLIHLFVRTYKNTLYIAWTCSARGSNEEIQQMHNEIKLLNIEEIEQNQAYICITRYVATCCSFQYELMSDNTSRHYM